MVARESGGALRSSAVHLSTVLQDAIARLEDHARKRALAFGVEHSVPQEDVPSKDGSIYRLLHGGEWRKVGASLNPVFVVEHSRNGRQEKVICKFLEFCEKTPRPHAIPCYRMRQCRDCPHWSQVLGWEKVALTQDREWPASHAWLASKVKDVIKIEADVKGYFVLVMPAQGDFNLGELVNHAAVANWGAAQLLHAGLQLCQICIHSMVWGMLNGDPKAENIIINNAGVFVHIDADEFVSLGQPTAWCTWWAANLQMLRGTEEGNPELQMERALLHLVCSSTLRAFEQYGNLMPDEDETLAKVWTDLQLSRKRTVVAADVARGFVEADGSWEGGAMTTEKQAIVQELIELLVAGVDYGNGSGPYNSLQLLESRLDILARRYCKETGSREEDRLEVLSKKFRTWLPDAAAKAKEAAKDVLPDEESSALPTSEILKVEEW